MPSALTEFESDQQADKSAETPAQGPGSSYRDILKSTAWIGGSQVINVLVSMVRAKAMALLLGPAGVGLNGMYWSVLSVAQNIAGLGVNSSGVRQVAEAIGSGDQLRVARTVAVLRRVSLWLGLAGGLVLVAGAGPIAQLTFGRVDQSETIGVALLSIVLLMNLVIAGQGALLQGLRKVSEMAQSNVLGSVAGTLAVIPLVYFWGRDGVVPALIAGSAAALAISWWFVRQIEIAKPRLTLAETKTEAWALTKLGFAFMISGLMMMLSGYLIRLIVMRFVGLEATGLYQAAWTLGGMYVSLVLQSMGVDFYPRLTAAIRDHATSVRLVNEQTNVSLLLAGPGVVATLVFSPLVLSVFYSSEFMAAVELLRWICLGVAMRAISWPLGFILMAEANQARIIGVEVAWTAVHLGLAWLLVPGWGITGAGIAFFGSYGFHIAVTYFLARRIIGFRWTAENVRVMALQGLAIAGTFLLAHFGSAMVTYAAGTTALVGITILSFRQLAEASGVPDRFRRWMHRSTAEGAGGRSGGSTTAGTSE